MTDLFPLRPDADWYAVLVSRYGEAVPPLEHLKIRHGMQVVVEDLLHELDIADRFRACRVHGIETRSAGFAIIDARFRDEATDADRRMCNRVLERARDRLTEACEHCGKPGEIFAKTGLEALFENPGAILGDRFLCMECYEYWRHRHD